jgi:hypothetical protein
MITEPGVRGAGQWVNIIAEPFLPKVARDDNAYRRVDCQRKRGPGYPEPRIERSLNPT